MKKKPLYDSLISSLSFVIALLRSRISIVDTHTIITTFKNRFPSDYALGLRTFKGNKNRFHGYLGRMLLKQKFGSISPIGFGESLNCNGRISKNSKWQL